MKNYYFLIVGFFAFLFVSCNGPDPVSFYHFIVKNETDKILTLDFKDSLPYTISTYPNPDQLVLKPNQEKRVRTFTTDAPNVADFRQSDFDFLFGGLVFDTYIDGRIIDKELWRSENWTFCSVSKNVAEYKMTITESDL